MVLDYQELLKQAMKKIPKKESIADRFKVPSVICEIQGPKTLVKNFAEIVTVLRRDPKHLSKFLFKELATPGFIQGNMLILNAKIGRATVQGKLDEYIKGFVFCKICGEPDTKLEKEDRLTFMKCEACGARTSVRTV